MRSLEIRCMSDMLATMGGTLDGLPLLTPRDGSMSRIMPAGRMIKNRLR